MSEVLLSQLAHVEVFSPRPQDSVDWYVDVLGLEETGRVGQSVYLRGWAEWLHSSLIVTEAPQPGLGHIGWRAYGPGDPEAVAKRLDGSEHAIGWVDESVGHGPAFRFHAPAGRQVHEVFWEVERYAAPPELATDNPSRPQRYTGRGAGARYIDHVTVASPNMLGDIDFLRETTGHRHTAAIMPEPGFAVFATMTANAVRSTHDLGLVPDFSGMTGRVNHVAYRVDQRLDVERAAEVFMAAGTPIEFGPGIHGIDEITYLYVREPGGLRVEVNSGGWENHQPDWEASTWHPTQGGTTFWRNVGMPESMMESFPPTAEAKAQMDSSGLFAES